MDRLQIESMAHEATTERRELEQERLAEERLEKIQNGGLIASHGGPTPEQYNYEMAARDIDFSEAPDGGIDLPNKYINYTQPVGGYDLQTGEHLYDERDPLGLARQGVEDIRNGSTNTQYGPDVRTVDGMLKVAYNGLKNGYRFDELGVNADEATAGLVSYVTESADIVDEAVAYFEAPDDGALDIVIRGPDRPVGQDVPGAQDGTLPPDEDEPVQWREETLHGDPMDPFAIIQRTDPTAVSRFTLMQDEQWLDATRRMWEFYTDDPYPGPEKATNAMVQQLAMISMNEIEMGLLYMAMRRNEMDVETAQALRYAYTMYDQMSIADRHIFFGMSAGFATSPVTYLGGIFGRAAYKAATKKGALRKFDRALQQYIEGNLNRQALVTGGAAGGVSLSTWMGGEELVRETAAVTAGERESVDVGRVAAMTAFGGAIGTVFGMGLAKALASEFTGNTMRLFKDVLRRKTGEPSYSELAEARPTSTAEEVEERFLSIIRGDEEPAPINMGLPLDEGFYSRIHVALQRHVQNAFGNAKELDPADILNRLDPTPPPPKEQRTKADRYRGAWLQGNERTGIPDISQHEIESMGLRLFLENKANAGEKINRLELDAFMYARSPQLRMGVAYDTYRHDLDRPGERIVPDDTFGLARMRPEQVASRVAGSALVSRIASKVEVQEEIVDGNSVFRWKDPVTQEDRSATYPYDPARPATNTNAEYIRARVIPSELEDAIVDNMDAGLIVRLMAEIDEKVLVDPVPGVRHAENALGVFEDLLDNYQEMRLFIPVRSKDVNDIAADRFGQRYDELSPEDRSWVDMASEHTLDPAMFNETAHFPLEVNRLAHIRMQDITVKTESGWQKVLFVDEMQSDMRNSAMRYAPERQVSVEARTESLNEYVAAVEKSVGPEFAALVRGQIEGIDMRHGITFKDVRAIHARAQDEVGKASVAFSDPQAEFGRKMGPINASFNRMVADWELADAPGYQPMTEGWREAALAQIFHRAAREGYTGVAFPTTGRQIEDIQVWKPGSARKHPSANIYLQWLPKTLARKSMAKRLGIDRVEEGTPRSDLETPPAELSDENVRVYIINPEQARASTDNMKPIYGAAGPVGAMQLLGQDDAQTNSP